MLSHDEQAAYLDSIERVRQSAVNHLGSNRNVAIEFVANLHRAVDKVTRQSAGSGAQTECRPGCACCCSVRVEATEPEIFRIAREVKKLPADRVAAIVERLRNFAAATDGAGRTDCAFLKDHLCSIYEVRPAVCRRAHSLSEESCKHFAPEIPQNLEILLQADALMKGTSEAYRQVGLHASAHELGSAVLQALTDETIEARWHDGEAVFPKDCG
ncbi:MAG: YkgJ family cysteine cluster protein [Gallionella sp.]|jgi:Fe-S-cluster containining protein|nr:YkgJ family cysteine cluster protein [Gallionella sp.]MCK9354996.1 YkgJ family cysteine cluster protein [Gallionella sp.]